MAEVKENEVATRAEDNAEDVNNEGTVDQRLDGEVIITIKFFHIYVLIIHTFYSSFRLGSAYI